MPHRTPLLRMARDGSPGSAARWARPVGPRALALLVLAASALALAGCSTGTQAATEAPPAATTPPVTATPARPTAPAPAVAPSTPGPTIAPTIAPPSPSASSAPVAFSSPFYRYRLTFPAGWNAGPARTAWDGTARIDSNGPLVDRASGPGAKLFFVYGAAPTDLDLAEWSARGQSDVNAWHGCPAVAESETDVTIGGSPGRLHAFHCNNLYVMKAFVVRDGFGWAFNQLAPPGNEAADTAALAEMLAGVDWTD